MQWVGAVCSEYICVAVCRKECGERSVVMSIPLMCSMEALLVAVMEIMPQGRLEIRMNWDMDNSSARVVWESLMVVSTPGGVDSSGAISFKRCSCMELG